MEGTMKNDDTRLVIHCQHELRDTFKIQTVVRGDTMRRNMQYWMHLYINNKLIGAPKDWDYEKAKLRLQNS